MLRMQDVTIVILMRHWVTKQVKPTSPPGFQGLIKYDDKVQAESVSIP